MATGSKMAHTLMTLNRRIALAPFMRPRYLALAIWKRLMYPTLCSAGLRKWLCRKLRFLDRSDMGRRAGFFAGASIWGQPWCCVCTRFYQEISGYLEIDMGITG